VAADIATFTYDITGGVSTASNGAAQVAREYYPNGALKADTQRIRTVSGSDFDQHKYVLQYTYDLDGRRVDLIHPSQLAAGAVTDRTTYAYDSTTGLPASVTDVMGNVFQMGYDFAGQLTSVASPDSINESDTYDGDGRLRTQQLVNGSHSAYKWPESYLRNASYGYDARGKVTRVYNTAGTADTLVARYSGLGHLVLDSMRTRGEAAVVWPDGGIGPFPIKYDAWETFSLDALGNIRRADAATRVWNGPQNYQTVASLKLDEYEAGVGRLARQQADQAIDTLVYDETGNTIWMSTVHNNGTAYQDRASYYGADGRLVAADRRSLNNYRANFEESRYDALGRRVWVRSRNACAGANSDPPLCRFSTIRRIVWDGDHELYEIQMPGGDADGTWHENDVAQVQLPVVLAAENGRRYDLNPHFGRVAYTTGLAIDQPLSVVRFGYRSLMDQYGNEKPALDWTPFAIMPRWTSRGLADIGTFDDGGVDRCTTFQGVQRCIWVDWPAQVYAYARTKMRSNAWHGSVTEDKADAAGTYYRRNRMYDPATGRFTQEDPIGLSGGLNLYGFAAGDPVNFADPFGLTPYVNCRPVGGSGNKGVVAHCAIRVIDKERNIDVTFELGPVHRGNHIYEVGPESERVAAYDPDGWVAVETPEGKTTEQFDDAVIATVARERSRREGHKYSPRGERNSNNFVYTVITAVGGFVPRSPSFGFSFGAPGLCGGAHQDTGGNCSPHGTPWP